MKWRNNAIYPRVPLPKKAKGLTSVGVWQNLLIPDWEISLDISTYVKHVTFNGEKGVTGTLVLRPPCKSHARPDSQESCETVRSTKTRSSFILHSLSLSLYALNSGWCDMSYNMADSSPSFYSSCLSNLIEIQRLISSLEGHRSRDQQWSLHID